MAWHGEWRELIIWVIAMAYSPFRFFLFNCMRGDDWTVLPFFFSFSFFLHKTRYRGFLFLFRLGLGLGFGVVGSDDYPTVEGRWS